MQRASQRLPKEGRNPASRQLSLIAIWAVTGAGYFWPIFPLLWFAFVGLTRVGHMRVTGNARGTR